MRLGLKGGIVGVRLMSRHEKWIVMLFITIHFYC